LGHGPLTLRHATNPVNQGPCFGGHGVGNRALRSKFRDPAAHCTFSAHFGEFFLHQSADALVQLSQLKSGLYKGKNRIRSPGGVIRSNNLGKTCPVRLDIGVVAPDSIHKIPESGCVFDVLYAAICLLSCGVLNTAL
jgi:hypothetical protein